MSERLENIEWRVIGRYPMFEVSEFGDVRRTGGRVLAGIINEKGYRQYCLSVDGRSVTVKAHRLVCEAWRGPRPFPSAHAAHRDGDRANNHFTNLRWATAKENNDDRYDHGTIPFGEEHPKAKLTWRDVREIRSRAPYRRGAAGRYAEEFGVSRTVIRCIMSGKTWPEDAELAAKVVRLRA